MIGIDAVERRLLDRGQMDFAIAKRREIVLFDISTQCRVATLPIRFQVIDIQSAAFSIWLPMATAKKKTLGLTQNPVTTR